MFAILVFAGVFFFLGKVDFPAVVGEVIKGGAAEQAGVLAGDRILKVNGKAVNSFAEVRQEVDMNTAEKVSLEIKRGEQLITLSFPLKVIPLEEEVNQPAEPQSHVGDSLCKYRRGSAQSDIFGGRVPRCNSGDLAHN